MEVRQYIVPHLTNGGIAIIISLDVRGAFGSAILQRLRNIKCPRNLYFLVKKLPEGEKGGHDNKQFQRRESHKSWLSTRGVLRATAVQHSI
jgi:hypothetical protein